MTQDTESKFIETLGLIWQSEGRPRISGQILGLLVLSKEPRSLGDIAQALGVSKASVSTNVRLLELYGMTSRVSKMGSRLDMWQASPDPFGATLRTLSERFARSAERIADIAQEFTPSEQESFHKVSKFADFYQTSAMFLNQWAETIDQAEAAVQVDPAKGKND